jgi:hypothetical protein
MSAPKAFVSAAVGLALLACSGGTNSEQIDESSQFQLTDEQARILGMEDPVRDWRTSNGTLSASSEHTEGAGALAVRANGYTEVYSVPFTTPAGDLDRFGFDLKVPVSLGWGDARVVL